MQLYTLLALNPLTHCSEPLLNIDPAVTSPVAFNAVTTLIIRLPLHTYCSGIFLGICHSFEVQNPLVSPQLSELRP